MMPGAIFGKPGDRPCQQFTCLGRPPEEERGHAAIDEPPAPANLSVPVPIASSLLVEGDEWPRWHRSRPTEGPLAALEPRRREIPHPPRPPAPVHRYEPLLDVASIA